MVPQSHPEKSFMAPRFLHTSSCGRSHDYGGFLATATQARSETGLSSYHDSPAHSCAPPHFIPCLAA